MKKIVRFLISMKFAVILLVILAVFLAAASFIPQNQESYVYYNLYGQSTASFFLSLGLDDVFHRWWFYALAFVLCLDLVLCNVRQIPGVIRRMKSEMPLREKIGSLGALVTHFGILVLIIGFIFGQITKEEYTVYGVPGETKSVGNTGLTLSIDTFDILMNDDDTVDRYVASIRMTDPSGNTEAGVVEVNAPGSFFGYRVYQNSFGYAVTAQVSFNGELLQEETVTAGETFAVKDVPDLKVTFGAFYPDYYFSREKGPATASNEMRNPAYLYGVTYGEETLGADILKGDNVITVDQYTIAFRNPRYYTLLQVKKDAFTVLALVGAAIVMIGLVFSFYLKKENAPQTNEKKEG